jgi:hypothetical protein
VTAASKPLLLLLLLAVSRLLVNSGVLLLLPLLMLLAVSRLLVSQWVLLLLLVLLMPLHRQERLLLVWQLLLSNARLWCQLGQYALPLPLLLPLPVHLLLMLLPLAPLAATHQEV